MNTSEEQLRTAIRKCKSLERLIDKSGGLVSKLLPWRKVANPPCITRARAVAARLLEAASGRVNELGEKLIAARISEGWVVVAFSREGETEVFRLNHDLPIYVVTISEVDVQSCQLLALSFWGSNRFLTSIPSKCELLEKAGSDGLPAGLDFVVETAASRHKKRRRVGARATPDWAARANDAIRGVREIALQLAYDTAVEMFLAHELGHVHHGHVPASGISYSRIRPSREKSSMEFPYFGAEIIADRWAAQTILWTAGQRRGNRPFSVNAAKAMLLGAIIPLLHVRGHEEFSPPDSPHGTRHPPVWFRCYDLVSQFKAINPQLARFSDQLTGLVSAVALHDRFFGTWLDPLLHGEPAEHARRLADDALTKLRAWEKAEAVVKVDLARRLEIGR